MDRTGAAPMKYIEHVHFDVGGYNCHIDLLFFHGGRFQYIVIELRIGKIHPEYAGN